LQSSAIESPAPSQIFSDSALVAKLRAGDEGAFEQLLQLYHRNMVGVARHYVRSPDIAEEVVQDTWLAVIEGLNSFEGRSSLKGWIYAIVANKARTRGVRDGRVKSFSELTIDGELGDPAIDPERFNPDGFWRTPPFDWNAITPEREVSDRQLLDLAREGLDKLPESQRAAIILRDIEGLSAEQACNILGISETNYRVLLHRGRTKLRAHMEGVLEAADDHRVAAN
jgi:RNA polymerase sigma-70 factor (ECF subfamily)